MVCYFCSQDLYCVRSDLGNLLKALGRLEEAKVCHHEVAVIWLCCLCFCSLVLFQVFFFLSPPFFLFHFLFFFPF